VNYFHEFNSLVALPSKSSSSSVPLQLSITVRNSNFSHFSHCGSIISNNANHLVRDELTVAASYYFYNGYYMDYLNNVDFSRANYTKLFMTQTANLSSNSTPAAVAIFEVKFIGNTFEMLNFLKGHDSDGSDTRKAIMIA
jgi:hypothetical protein